MAWENIKHLKIGGRSADMWADYYGGEGRKTVYDVTFRREGMLVEPRSGTGLYTRKAAMDRAREQVRMDREYEKSFSNPGKAVTLRNMASVTIKRLPGGAVKISGRKMAGKSNPRRRAYQRDRPESPRSSPYDTWFLVWHGDPKIMDRGLMHEGTHREMAAYKAGLVAKGLPAKSMKIERFKLKYAGQGR